nr:zinc finger protein Xfin-like isoform X2 [Aedes albopictus]
MATTEPLSGCRLCLDPFAESCTTIDNPEFKEKMEKVFTFQINTMTGISDGVCQTCSYTIADFYQYSEKVRENQQNLTNLPSHLGVPLDCELLCEEVKVELGSEAENEEFSDEAHPDFSSDSDSSYEPPRKKSQIKSRASASKIKCSETSQDQAKPQKATTRSTATEDLDEEDQFLKDHFTMTCELCGATASTFPLLRDHFRAMHAPEEPYVMCCDKRFIRRYDLLHHVKWHVNPNAFQCELCQRQYKSKDALVMHQQIKHSKKSVTTRSAEPGNTPIATVKEDVEESVAEAAEDQSEQCDEDEKLAEEDKYLKQHFTITCQLCGVTVSTFLLLRDHFRAEHDSEEHYVVCCDKRFTRRYDLVNHVKYHVDPNAFQCELCQRQYKSKEALVGHLKNKHDVIKRKYKQRKASLEAAIENTVSEGSVADATEDQSELGDEESKESVENEGTLAEEDKFLKKHFTITCPLCDVTASTFLLLRDHFLAEHASEEHYVMCCDKRFTRRYDLLNHVKCHVDPNAFQCELCQRPYKSKEALVGHLKNKHDVIKRKYKQRKASIEAAIESTISEGSVADATEDQSVLCDEESKESIENEETLAEEDKFLKKHFTITCPLCDVTASTFLLLRDHFLAEHSSEEHYVICCDKRFTRRYDLLNHVKCHVDPNAFQCELCKRQYKSKEALAAHLKNKHAVKHVIKRKNEQRKTSIKMAIKSTVIEDFVSTPVKLTTIIETAVAEASAGQSKQGSNRSKRNEEMDQYIRDHFTMTCELCNAIAPSFAQLSDHFLEFHPAEQPFVMCCNKRFIRRYDLLYHVKWHVEPNAFKCELCQKQYKSKDALVMHKQVKHNSDLVLLEKIAPGNKAKTTDSDVQPKEPDTVKRKGLREQQDEFISKHIKLKCDHCGATKATFCELRSHYRVAHKTNHTYVTCCGEKYCKRNLLIKHLEGDGHTESCDEPEIDVSTEVHPKIEELTIQDVLEEATVTEEHAVEEHLLPWGDFSPEVHQPEEYEEKKATQIEETVTTNFSLVENESAEKETKLIGKTNDNVAKQRGLRNREDNFINKHITLTCYHCNAVEPTFTELRNHFRAEHSSNNVYVICCGEKINQRGLLVEHLESHTSVNNSANKFCNSLNEPPAEILLEKQTNLNELTKLDAEEEDFPAEVSNASIPSGGSDSETETDTGTVSKKKKALDQGDQFLSENFTMECDICGVAATTFSLLRRHFLAKHKDIKVYAKCCDKKFDRRCLLLNHVKCHVDPNAFQCDQCRKRYKSYDGLELHKRIKHGLEIEKTTKPESSDGESRRRRPKVKGMRDHQDEFISKHFELECDHCGIKKSTFAELRSHFRIEHDTNNVYVMCCNQKISKRASLIEHLKGHGGSNTQENDRDERATASEESSEEGAGDQADKELVRKQEMDDDQFISENVRVVCEVCGVTAQTFSGLRDHFHAEHGSQNPYVMCCQNKFFSRQTLVDHVRYHVKPDAFECEYCHRRYLCNDSLVLHKQIKHASEYQKELEGALQSQSVRTKKNEQKANEDQFLSKHFTLTCEHCGATESTFGELRTHFRQVHQSFYTYVKCCERKFFKRSHIVQHIEEHLRTTGLLCKKCGSSFSTKDDLTAHTLNCTIPDDVPLYKCNHCPQQFVQEAALDAHMEQHKLLECSECKKRFLNSMSLNTHTAKEHSHKSDQLYVCEHCGKNFVSELGLKRHIDYAHLGIEAPRIQCQICERWLKRGTYKSHMDYVHGARDRVYECDICHKEYSHLRALQNHKKQTHAVPKFTCEFCNKMFRQKMPWVEHRATHTGEVLYSCDLCGEPYRGKSSLYAHLKKKHATEWSERKQKIWKGIPAKVVK